MRSGLSLASANLIDDIMYPVVGMAVADCLDIFGRFLVIDAIQSFLYCREVY